MAESPPHVVVSTVGVKTDYGELVPRSAKTPPPPDAPRVADDDEGDRDD